MKNIKVRTKLTIILALVIVLVTSESFISIKNMNQLKDKALETMDTSSRQNYDDSIKEQVGVVISLLSEINNEYKSGKYTLDEAKKIAADEIRQMRYGEAGYFWVDQSDGKNIVLLGSSTEGTNRMNTKDADGYQMVKEIIRVAVQDGGGYTDYVFPKEGETEPSPKRSYSEYFKPFDWVVGTGNYTDYIDTAIAQQDEEFTSYASSKAISLILCSVCMLIFHFNIDSMNYISFYQSNTFQHLKNNIPATLCSIIRNMAIVRIPIVIRRSLQATECYKFSF